MKFIKSPRHLINIAILLLFITQPSIYLNIDIETDLKINSLMENSDSREELEYSIFYSLPKPGTTTTRFLQYSTGNKNPIISPRPATSTIDEDYCIIMIDFTDVTMTKSSNEINSLMFSSSSSLKSYFLENSYETYTIGGQVVGNKVYRSTDTMAYYGEDDSNGEIDRANGHPNELALDALELAVDDIDYSNFDNNGDGIVDHLIIIHAGYGQEEDPEETNRIWSHYSGLYTKIDDVIFKDYVMVSEYSPMGVIAHECGHDLGLIDLYDVDYTSDGIGIWGIMAAGGWLSAPSHFCAYNKILLGWMTPQLITNAINTQVSIRQRNLYPDVVKVQISEKEYYLLENIFRQGSQYDLSLPGDGILITHIDDSQTSNTYERNDIDALFHVPFYFGVEYKCFNENREIFSIGNKYHPKNYWM